MKKKVCVILLSLIFLEFLSISVYGVYSEENLLEDTRDKLYSVIDSDTADILDALGADITKPETIGEFSLSSILEYFSEDFKSKLQGVLKQSFVSVSLIVILSMITLPSDRSNTDLIEYISVCIIILISFSEISSLIKAIISVISLSSDFLLGYIPVFAALIAMSGNVATALSYNTLLLTVAEISSRILSSLSERAVGIYFALVTGFSLNRNINLSRFVSSFSKCTSWVVGLVASVFAAFLTVKSVFSVNIDTVGSKGIRFVLSSLIPVVGSAISDAYSTLLGSIGLVKSSVAVIGIAASLIMNLPVLFEGLCFCLSYNFLSFTAEILSAERASAAFKAISSGIRFLLLIQLFLLFILIVSTALMVNLKSTI